MTPPDLAIVGLDDPADPRSWSGTPWNLTRALQARGITTVSAHVTHDRSIKGLGAAMAVAGGADAREWRRPWLARRRASALCTRLVKDSGASAALHMGSLALPINGRAPWRTYAFLDSTLHQWGLGSVDSGLGRRATFRRWDDHERNGFDAVDHFFVVSRETRDSLLHHYGVDPSLVTVTGTGMGFSADISPKQGGWDSGRLLFVAKQRFRDKGADLLLQAFRIAQDRRPDLTLHVVGGGPDFAGSLLPTGVHVHQALSLEELHHQFREASLFVMPARNEPWGLVYVESLAFGLPILGVNRNGFPDICADGRHGYVAADLSPEAVAHTILEALADPDTLRAKGESGSDFVRQRYSWSEVASNVAARIDTR